MASTSEAPMIGTKERGSKWTALCAATFSSVYEVDSSAARIIPMEGVRGLAVLLVFFVHFDGLFRGLLPESSLPSHVLRLVGTVGHAGVDLFFVLSGYLIYGLLVRRNVGYWPFIRRRIVRIYPTFLAVLGIYTGLSALFPAENKIHGTLIQQCVYLAQNVLLLPGTFNIRPIVTVTWSLSLELLFYLTVPLLMILVPLRSYHHRWRISALFGLWGLYILICHFITGFRPRFAGFFAGMLLFDLAGSPWIRVHLSRLLELMAAAIFLVSIGFITLYSALAPTGRDLGSAIFIGPAVVAVVNAGAVLFVLCACHFDGLLNRLFSWTPIRWLGNVSYSYYLIHGLALKAMSLALAYFGVTRSSAGVLLLVLLPSGFAATWLAASALFITIEKPLSIQARVHQLATR